MFSDASYEWVREDSHQEHHYLTGIIDHHCPWINNCVGHANYGYFIRFLVLVDIACAYHLTMVTNRIFDGIRLRYFVSSS